ncbi:MAG: sialate O-acetylesterase, partial [Dysgonamonadaceae bacterium]|nr:sialate O-acetylesterase [Dysgonamonadaceae bacterium]
PNADWVSSEDLTTLEDGTHFDRQSCIAFGARYAEKVIAKCYTNTTGIGKTTSAGHYKYRLDVDAEKIVIRGLERTATLSVYDTCGRKLLSENIADGYSFTLPQQGICLLSIRDNESVYQTKIWIK